MNLAILLHLYQPPTQTEAAFKAITQECYIPLLKLIKSKSSCKFTLNTPLSLLEQFEKYGYSDLISQIKELVEAERVELVGSAAYHPLLNKLSSELMSRQIILNEYGLGYYYGQRQGFEGEISMMVKDIRGFFPPEMAVNKDVLKVLDDLNYEWVMVDGLALSGNEGSGVYSISGVNTKLICRNSVLSNMLSFKRDDNVDEINAKLMELSDHGQENVVLALDAEVFGHHNREGIYMLEGLIDGAAVLKAKLVTVSDVVSSADAVEVSGIKDSTWSDKDLWSDSKNKIQVELWKVLNLVSKEFVSIKSPAGEEGFENIATWKESELKKLSNDEFKEYLELEILVFKSMHSDQFWWASNATVYDKVLYSPNMVKKALDIYKKVASFDSMKSLSEKIHQMSDDISRQLV